MSKFQGFLPLVLVLSYLLSNVSVLTAENKMKAPFANKKQNSVSSHNYYVVDSSQWVWGAVMSFYSDIIGPADGARSPSYPTGSMYGRMAIKKHGFFLGIILTADRLLHESDLPLTPSISIYNKRRFYDPLEFNTFWWEDGSPWGHYVAMIIQFDTLH